MLGVSGVGRLTQDPEIVHTQSSSLAKFTIAFNGTNGKATFKNCSTFKNPDNFLRYMKKGSQVYIIGELKTDEWTDRNSGETRKAEVILVLSWSFVGKKEDSTEADDVPQQSKKGGKGEDSEKAGNYSTAPAQQASYEDVPY
jgi:single stranded DNA-binding protein